MAHQGTANAAFLMSLAALWKQGQTDSRIYTPPSSPTPAQQASNIIMRVTTNQHLLNTTSNVTAANINRHNQELTFEEPVLWGSEVVQAPYSHIGWRVMLANGYSASDTYVQNLYIFKAISADSFGGGVWLILDEFTPLPVPKNQHTYDSGLKPLSAVGQLPMVPGRDRVTCIVNYDITDKVNPPYTEFDGYLEIYGGYAATTGSYVTN